MLNIPVLRWGKPYESLEADEVSHFITGEPLARVGQANPGLLGRDIRKVKQAREALKKIPTSDLVQMMKKAADLYLNGTLPLGDGVQSPDDFARMQSATTGLPEVMCRGNMEKNHFVLSNMDQMLEALTRGLPLSILTQGYGEEGRGVTVSYQVQSPALGMVLPSNSPGVHTLWLPVIPMQVGLILKPGPQEPWTPYRMATAFFEAGVPREAISIYPGGADMGAEVVSRCRRTMIFGGAPTVERYAGDPRVQVHGPGFSKIMLADDLVDRWEDYIDIMVDSVFLNSGRGCINCSGIWASRHTKEIAAAVAERIGPVEPKDPSDPDAQIAAFTVPGVPQAISQQIDALVQTPGAEDMTARYGARLVEMERCGYLRPTVIHCDAPDHPLANTEYMFPFVSVVKCPQDQMIEKMGPTLVLSAITDDQALREQLIETTGIDRLNLGAMPTIKMNWLQPHEGNIVDFLFRARALQIDEKK